LEQLKENVNRDLSWEEALQEDIEFQENMIEENQNTVSSGELSEMKVELEELKYLREHNIETEEDFDFNGFSFINDLVEQLGHVFLAIGIAVFAADIVSGEWTPPTMKLLLTQPVSRG